MKRASSTKSSAHSLLTLVSLLRADRLRQSLDDHQGLTLIETLVSVVILSVTLVSIIPLFAAYKVSIIQNEIETGAIAISHRILDEIRQVDITTLPEDGIPTSDLPTTGNNAASSLTYLGKDYSASITYCRDTTHCGDKSRSIEIDVNHNGETVYEVDTVFTQFD